MQMVAIKCNNTAVSTFESEQIANIPFTFKRKRGKEEGISLLY